MSENILLKCSFHANCLSKVFSARANRRFLFLEQLMRARLTIRLLPAIGRRTPQLIWFVKPKRHIHYHFPGTVSSASINHHSIHWALRWLRSFFKCLLSVLLRFFNRCTLLLTRILSYVLATVKWCRLSTPVFASIAKFNCSKSILDCYAGKHIIRCGKRYKFTFRGHHIRCFPFTIL